MEETIITTVHMTADGKTDTAITPMMIEDTTGRLMPTIAVTFTQDKAQMRPTKNVRMTFREDTAARRGTATTAAKAHTAMLLKAVITTIRRKALTAAPTTADRAMVTTDVTIETSPAHPNVTIMCAASTTISSATTPAKGSSHRMVTAEDPHIPSAM